MTAAPLRLGIAGLGTVGVGVLKMIHKNAKIISLRTGRDIVVTAVSARSRSKDRVSVLSVFPSADALLALSKRLIVTLFVDLIVSQPGLI